MTMLLERGRDCHHSLDKLRPVSALGPKVALAPQDTRVNGGPYDTVPVGQYPQGQSPYGVLDMAGQVFEWTATPAQLDPPHCIVKGDSWDDLPGVTCAAARHARPAELKHILIGFRSVISEAD